MKLFGKRAEAPARPALVRPVGSYAGGSWAGGGDWPRGYEAQVRDAYLGNPIAQRAVRIVAEGASGVPVYANAEVPRPAKLLTPALADTAGFGQDVAVLKGSLEQGVGAGADKAGRAIETALVRAVRTGKLGFDDLRGAALKVLEEIAAAAIKAGIGGATQSGGGIAGVAGSLLTAALGLPGRATGGPVTPGAPYLVGERGPEVFVPTGSGAVAPLAAPAGRDVRVSIAINAGAGDAPAALARSGRQVARAVSRALAQAEG